MTSLNFAKGDQVAFKPNELYQDLPNVLTGVIIDIDYSDSNKIEPYLVKTSEYGQYWIAEEDITDRVGATQLERIERKLDAIIRQFNINVEGL